MSGACGRSATSWKAAGRRRANLGINPALPLHSSAEIPIVIG
jgi:hypothetical protein